MRNRKFLLTLGLIAMLTMQVMPVYALTTTDNGDGTTTTEIQSSDKNNSNTTRFSKATTVVSSLPVGNDVIDDLDMNLKVTLPNTLDLTYNSGTKEFDVESYTKVTGMMGDAEHIEIAIPSTLGYKLNGTGDAAFNIKPEYGNANRQVKMYPTETYRNTTENKTNNLKIHTSLDDIKSGIKVKGTYKADVVFNTKIIDGSLDVNESSREKAATHILTSGADLRKAAVKENSLAGAVNIDTYYYTGELNINCNPDLLADTESVLIDYNTTDIGNSLSKLGYNTGVPGVADGTLYTTYSEEEFNRKFEDANIPATVNKVFNATTFYFESSRSDLYKALKNEGVDVDNWSSLTTLAFPKTTRTLEASAVQPDKDFSNIETLDVYADIKLDLAALSTLGTSKAVTLNYHGTQEQWDKITTGSSVALNPNVTLNCMYVASTSGTDFNKSDWDYSLDTSNNYVTLNTYKGADKDVTVYGTYNIDGEDYQTYISKAFYNNTAVENIVFDDSKGKTIAKSYLPVAKATALKTIDVKGLDTSQLTSFKSMFWMDSSLTDIKNIDALDSSKATSMEGMFQGCSSLTFSGDLATKLKTLDTSKVTSFKSTFAGTSAATTIDITGWDTSAATIMDSMFSNCAATSIKVGSGWNTSGATTSSMFSNAGTSEVTQE